MDGPICESADERTQVSGEASTLRVDQGGTVGGLPARQARIPSHLLTLQDRAKSCELSGGRNTERPKPT
jgi:hypothetical protein